MHSSFFGFNIAQQGLYTARNNLDIANHNISNANTKGYSRQYGNQQANKPMSVPGYGMVGTGASVISIDQFRDAYLDSKFRNTNQYKGESDVKKAALDEIEMVFNEPSKTGITSHFDHIFKTLQELSKNPSNESAKTQVINSMLSFTNFFNDMSSQLTSIQKDMDYNIKETVDQINIKASQIATLNAQINDSEIFGGKANDLRDQRNVLIDELSSLVSIDVQKSKNSQGQEILDITVDGHMLVSDVISDRLEVEPREYKNNPEDYPNLCNIKWSSGQDFNMQSDKISGKLMGYIAIRDGNGAQNFNGDIEGVQSIPGDATHKLIKINNVKRTDISESGVIDINGYSIKYDGVSYGGYNGNGTDATLDDKGSIYLKIDNSELPRICSALNQSSSSSGGAYNPSDISADIATINANINGAKATAGEINDYKGVAYYKQRLNEFVRTISRKFNEIQEKGEGQTGVPLFVFEGYKSTDAANLRVDKAKDSIDADDVNEAKFNYNAINAGNIVINPGIINNPNLFMNKSNVGDGESASDIIDEMIELRGDINMFEQGKPDNYIQSIVSVAAIDTREVTSYNNSQNNILQMIHTQRLSVQDVDVNEEVTNLIKFQQAYSLSAKVINTFNEIYDVTINQLGL